MPDENVQPQGGTPEGGAAAGSLATTGAPAAAPAAPATPETGAPAAAPSGLVPEWIPERLRSHKTLHKFKTGDAAAEAYVSLESSLGNKVSIPAEDAKPEDKAAFWNRLGRPETAEGYVTPTPPEGRELDKGALDWFAKVAHEHGLTKAQHKAVVEGYMNRQLDAQMSAAVDTKAEEAASIASLNERWGAATDRNIGICQQFVTRVLSPGFAAALDRTGAGNDPEIIAGLAMIGQQYIEDGLMPAEVTTTTVKDAQSQIDNIMAAGPKHPFWNGDDPGHKKAVEDMRKLHELANPQVR